MTGSLFFKIAIGLLIFLSGIAHQLDELRQFAPSLDDFRQTTNVSGIYSYEHFARNNLTRIDDKLFFCALNYNGGIGSCYVFLKNLPENSKITIAAASPRTKSGNVLYATRIIFNGYEVYRKTPKQSLHDWWFASCLEVSEFPLLLMAIYLSIIFALTKRKQNRGS